MSMAARTEPSVCPHDCPSVCALEVELLDDGERFHHPGRLTTPLRRRGAKGSGDFVPVAWDDALDIVADALLRVAERDGPEAVWPYYYAGTMGLVQRDGINRLRH